MGSQTPNDCGWHKSRFPILLIYSYNRQTLINVPNIYLNLHKALYPLHILYLYCPNLTLSAIILHNYKEYDTDLLLYQIVFFLVKFISL